MLASFATADEAEAGQGQAKQRQGRRFGKAGHLAGGSQAVGVPRRSRRAEPVLGNLR
jgi:hypothetical protein